MKFLLSADENKVQGATGEISYRISETEQDGVFIPQLKIVLAINRFFTDITKVKCDLGVFCDTHLDAISGGSTDPFVIYELTTSSFSFDAANIETLLLQLGSDFTQDREEENK